MEDKKEERVAIFIDGSNLYHIVKSLFPNKKPNNFNFEKFVEYLARSRNLIRKYYYNVTLDIMRDAESYMKQQRFLKRYEIVSKVCAQSWTEP